MAASTGHAIQAVRVCARGGSPAVRRAVGVLGFAALTALGAHVRIPVPGTPVPMTLQLLAVLLAGFVLPAPAAMVSMGLYVAAGAAGLGVFAPGSAGLFGLTGGYLCGFVLGAAVLACLRGRSRSWARLTSAGAVSVAVILCCGVFWQTVWFGLDPGDAIRIGAVPFLPKAILELVLAVAMVRLLGGRRRPEPLLNEKPLDQTPHGV